MKVKVVKPKQKKECTCGSCVAQPTQLVTHINSPILSGEVAEAYKYNNDIQNAYIIASYCKDDNNWQNEVAPMEELMKLSINQDKIQSNLSYIYANTVLPQIDAKVQILTEQFGYTFTEFLKSNCTEFSQFCKKCSQNHRHSRHNYEIVNILGTHYYNKYDSLTTIFYSIMKLSDKDKDFQSISDSQNYPLINSIMNMVCNVGISVDNAYAKAHIPADILQIAALHASIIYQKTLDLFVDSLMDYSKQGYSEYDEVYIDIKDIGTIYNIGKNYIDTWANTELVTAFTQIYTEVYTLILTTYHPLGNAKATNELKNALSLAAIVEEDSDESDEEIFEVAPNIIQSNMSNLF